MNFPRHPWLVDDGIANNGPRSVFLGSLERETLYATLPRVLVRVSALKNCSAAAFDNGCVGKGIHCRYGVYSSEFCVTILALPHGDDQCKKRIVMTSIV